MLNCPSVLGDGVQTNLTYCDVQIGIDPAAGIIVTLPAHSGPVTLMFDLHNRHTYSEELDKAKKAYSRYTATIGILTMNNDLLSQGGRVQRVQDRDRSRGSHFGRQRTGRVESRGADRVEAISIAIPAEEQRVSILGEQLSVVRIDGVDNFTTSGRPIALISNVRVTYTPAKPAPTPAKPAPPRRK